MDKKQVKHMVELFDSLTVEKKIIFMDTLEKLATGKDKKRDTLTDAGAIIDRTLQLFEIWKDEHEDREDLRLIFKGALLTKHTLNEITESDIDELTGFVGAMRMFNKI